MAAELVPRACGIVRIEVKGRNTMCKTALAFIRRGIVSFYFLLEMTLPSRSSAETSWVPEILSTLWATKKLELITSVITLILIGVFLKKLAEGLADYIKQATTWTTSRFSDRAFFHRRFYQKFVAVLDEETRKWQFSHGRPFDMDSFYIRVRLTSLPAFFVNIDASASDWEQTWTQRRNEPRLEPREALNKYQRLAVIGQPGIGKTTLLRYLSYLYAFDKAADPVDDGRTSFWTRWIWPLSRPSQQDRKAVGSARLDSHQKERRSRHHVHYGWRSGHRVPIYISLKELTLVSDFVAYLPIYFERHNFPKAKRFIEKKLRAGEFVFLLDALDEVEEYKEFIRITNLLADFINRYCNDQYKNLVVITSRPQSYLQCVHTLNCQIVEILEFDPQQIRDFIVSWFVDESKRGEKLWQIISADKILLEISGNPLMLSLIVETYDQRNELATSRRAELFGQIVNVRFWEWDSVRRVRRDFKFTQPVKERFLMDLALRLNDTAHSLVNQDELLQDVKTFIKQTNLGDPDEFDLRHGTISKRFLWEIAEGSGILFQKAIAAYDFSHKTLREYFTALRLCELSDGGSRLRARLRRPPFDRWEMVGLFYAGKNADATGLIKYLLHAHLKIGPRFLFLAARCLLEAAHVQDRELIASQICDALFKLVVDAGPEFRAEGITLLKTLGSKGLEGYVLRLLDGPLDPKHIEIATQLMPERISAHLQELVAVKFGESQKFLDESGRSKAAVLLAQADGENAVTPLLNGLDATKTVDRVRAALALAKLNRADEVVINKLRRLTSVDPDPEARHACRDALLVLGHSEEFDMVPIPSGEFVMGMSEEQIELLRSKYGWHRRWFASETPQRRVDLPQFYIDRTPVTNAQFASFAGATNYETTAEIRDKGWIKTAGDDNVSEVKGVNWRQPRGPGSSWEDIPDHPVVLLSWQDIASYAAWAGKKIPTEAQWEKAARGADGRLWPWGNEWNGDLCNSAYRHLPRGSTEESAAAWWENFDYTKHGSLTTPVGSFPDGASPYGVLDCVGNVCERTSDWFKPYPGATHKSDHYGEKLQVMRGGAWHHTAILARISARDYAHPSFCTVHDGFRCVVEIGDKALAGPVVTS